MSYEVNMSFMCVVDPYTATIDIHMHTLSHRWRWRVTISPSRTKRETQLVVWCYIGVMAFPTDWWWHRPQPSPALFLPVCLLVVDVFLLQNAWKEWTWMRHQLITLCTVTRIWYMMWAWCVRPLPAQRGTKPNWDMSDEWPTVAQMFQLHIE